MDGHSEQEEQEEMENDLKDLTWKKSDDKSSNKKSLNQFKQLAQGVITAINEDAEWLELVAPENPCIVVITTESKDLFHEIRRRGFIPKYCVDKGGDAQTEQSLVLALTLSPRLFLKLAIEHSYPLQPQEASAAAHVARIYTAALLILPRIEGLQTATAFLMQDRQKLAAIAEAAGSPHSFSSTSSEPPQALLPALPLEQINDYFGSEAALYFGWLRFYSLSLCVPAVAGVGLFALQMHNGEVDHPWGVPLYSLLVLLGGEAFLSTWPRECAVLTFSWGVMGTDEEERKKQLSREGVMVSNKAAKYLITTPLLVLLLLAQVVLMLQCMHLMDEAAATFGADSWLQHLPLVIYSALPGVLGPLGDWAAKWLNDFERHEIEHTAKEYLVFKRFAFHFVNNYAGLLYVAFCLQDLARLRTLLASLLVVGAVLNHAMEFYGSEVACAVYRGKACLLGGGGEPETGGVQWVGRCLDQDWDRDMRSDVRWRKVLIEELRRPVADVGDDYLEMVLQYGHISMFAAALPVAPALALLNNLLEAKSDLAKLLKSRRLPLKDRSSLGSWGWCLRVVHCTGLVTNCFLLCRLSDSLVSCWLAWLPPSLLDHLQCGEGAAAAAAATAGGLLYPPAYVRYVLMLLLEHALVLLLLAVSAWLSGVPDHIQKKAAMAETARKSAQVAERLQTYKILEKDYAAESLHAAMEDRREVSRKLQTPALATQFGYNPMFLLCVFVTPTVLSVINVSPFLYFPVALGFFSYLWTKKDRHDRGVAMAIVDDPNILKHIIGELPAWVKHSDVERLAWLNSVLHKLWPKLSIATEKYMVDWLQPLLDASKPPGFNSLDLVKFTLGSTALKFAGIRYQHTDENLVRLDLEIKWAGNPEIVIEVGRKSFPLKLEITNLRFSAILRVELTPLVPVFPGFGAISFCFMEKPFIDFSFSVGALDVMNIGPADMNVATVVDNTVRGILESYMLYPKKYVMPWLEEVDLQALLNPKPVGLLVLHLKSAKDLIIADLFSSDPFVQFVYMQTTYKSPVVYKSLNPTWNHTVELMVFDKEAQGLEFTLWDADLSGSNDLLGRAKMRFSALKPSGTTAFDLELHDTTSGSLQISCEYVALMQASKASVPLTEDAQAATEALNDILFQMTPDMLGNDILETDPGVFYHRSEDRAISPAAQSPLSPGKTSRQESQGVAEVANSTFKKSKGKALGSGRRKAKSKPGVLSISEIRCRNIKSTSKMSSKLKAYVSATCGSTVKRTLVQPNLSDPSFEECFHLIVRDGMTAALTLRVMDEYKWVDDECVGSVPIMVSDVILEEGCVEQEYVLDQSSRTGGGQDEVFLACKLEWSPAAEDFF